MKKIVFLFSFFLPLLGFAEEAVVANLFELSQDAPKELKGILFLGSWDQVRIQPSHPVYAVVCHRVELLQKNRKFLRKLQESYLGKELNQETIQQIQSEVANFYREKNQPLVAVSIPKQHLSEGILQVVVEEAKVGNITVRGNQYYTPDQLKKFISAKPGEALNMTELVQDLTRMNQNPFRRTDLIFKPGKSSDVTDLELATIDRWPYRLYMGGDNTGTAPTDRQRLFFGFNFGKTIVQDADISYQFTCSPNWNLFYAHTVSCHIPTVKSQSLILFGGYCQTEPKPGSDSDRSVAWQVDGRYRFPFMTQSNFLQEILVGYDFKQITSRTVQGGADINQFMIGYDLGQRGKLHNVSFTAELYGNPTGITTRNKRSDYEKFRSQAEALYSYLKVFHSFSRKIHSAFSFSYDIQGQISTANLLPSEQINLAGYHAVRGFEERAVSADNGLLINTSLETARWSLGKSFGITKKALDELYFLLFFDCGFGGNHKEVAAESSFVSLGSVGPGVKYQIDRWFSAHFDYGFQLWHHGFNNPTQSRYNFGLMMSY